MPSIFPGMDPFIEGQRWTDFHARFIVALSDELLPKLGLEYAIRVEEHVYVEHVDEAEQLADISNIVIVRGSASSTSLIQQQASLSNAAMLEPVERTLPRADKAEEKYLVVYNAASEKVVTVIELLSPSNKRKGSAGRVEYLDKRESILDSPTNLVELDLLRGGARLPTVEPLPTGDYYAFIARAEQRPKVAVYAWPLAHRLPLLPIPLDDDEETTIDLQMAFDQVFDRSRYATALNYDAALQPPLSDSDAAWVAGLLKNH